MSDSEEQRREFGLSLDSLDQELLSKMDRGTDPYRSDENRDSLPTESQSDSCPVTPKTIFEAMLFVGHPRNEPLTREKVASLMRGVRPAEIDDLVAELNAEYEAQNACFRIVSHGAGYMLSLVEELSYVRNSLADQPRPTKLSQGAIDVLSIVAYHQPITMKEVDELRGSSSHSIASQLIRRDMIEVVREGKVLTYRTTKRFLEFFSLKSLADLPRIEE